MLLAETCAAILALGQTDVARMVLAETCVAIIVLGETNVAIIVSAETLVFAETLLVELAETHLAIFLFEEPHFVTLALAETHFAIIALAGTNVARMVLADTHPVWSGIGTTTLPWPWKGLWVRVFRPATPPPPGINII